MGTFWKCVLVKFVLNKFVLTKDLVYCMLVHENERKNYSSEYISTHCAARVPHSFPHFFLRNFLWNNKKVSVALEIVDISSKSKVKSKWKMTSNFCSLSLLFPSILFELQYCHINMIITHIALHCYRGGY